LLPLVAEEECFALKGGTAINVFVRDLPRLSVDIDLVYLPMNNRDEALKYIKQALSRIAKRINNTFPNVDVVETYKDKSDALRLVVSRNGVKVKIELSPVLRGTVFAPEMRDVCQKVEDEFGYVEMMVVAEADLYAGKLCAALDRQHPRDLFDVKYLFENEGLASNIRKALLVYLISHPRPMAELLEPVRKELKHLYEGEFLQMEQEHVALEDLELTREKLIQRVNEELTAKEKQFLLSFKNKTPNWNLIELEGIENLPAVKWKMLNLKKMETAQYNVAYEKLEKVLKL
jgi:predicted nucleotidyltransferase component of viral defense system